MRIIIFFFLIIIVLIRLLTQTPSWREGDLVRISSAVYNEPSIIKNKQKLKIANLNIFLPVFPQIYYGDYIVIEGEVNGSELKNPVIRQLKHQTNFLPNFRNKLLDFYKQGLPEPHSSLVAGIVIGSKESIPFDFWDSLRRTGTLHVVVASGMNVTFVAAFFLSLFICFLPRRVAVILAILGIWLYSCLAGFQAPIIRAAIMGTISFGAQIFGKVYNALNALIITLFLMVLIDPQIVFDLGFILTFGATLGLIIFESRINDKLKFIPEIFRQGLASSLAAQIVVLPIIFYYFRSFNILSPLINALVLWTIPIIILIGSMAGVIGVLAPPLGKIILLLAYPMTFWFVKVIGLFS